MSQNLSFYVYALKDPRVSPARPFYIGKGTGVRSFDHLVRPDQSRKGDRIREIEASGNRVLVTKMVEELTEPQALRIEAELISSFGTIETGGILLNTVIPKGVQKATKAGLVVPSGVQEKAQLGLELLKDAILEFAKANPKGITNADAAGVLRLRSDYGGGSKDYLSYSVLGILMREGRLERVAGGKHMARVA